MKNKKRNKKQTKLSLGHQIRRQVVDLFVPHKRNGFRPRLISRYGLGIIILAVAIGVWTTLPRPDSGVLGDQALVTPVQLIEGVNQRRQETGAAPLTLNYELSTAADKKARDMIDNQYWAHTSPTGVTPWQWVSEAGYQYAYAGENLAKNFTNSQATVAAWMASPAHRDNMLQAYYTEAGLAVVDGVIDGKTQTVIVALFATPSSSLTAVAGATTRTPSELKLDPVTSLGVTFQAMSPTAIGAMVIATLAMIIAAATFVSTHWPQLHPQRVPVKNRTSWYRHHALIKTNILAVATIGGLMLMSTQQIL